MKKIIFLISLLILTLGIIGYTSVFAQIDESSVSYKSAEIAKQFPSKVSYTSASGDDVVIEGVSDEGAYVQLFVRAWKGDAQYGFGKNASIETERVRVFNPPLLVPDGTTHEWCNDFGLCGQVNNYKKDPEAALKSIIGDMVRTSGALSSSIVVGSVGRTTDIFYPYHDGEIFKDNSSSWSTTHDSVSGNTVNNSGSVGNSAIVGQGASDYNIGRYFSVFDTSSLPDTDTVDSATISMYRAGTTRDSDNDGEDYLVWVSNSQVSPSTLSASDFSTIGSTAYTDTQDITGMTTNQYYDWNLNSTGISSISKTGYSYLAMREGHDILNHAYAGSTSNYNNVDWYYVSQTGTTNDPKLTITHTADNSPNAPTSLLTEGQTNPTDITDMTPEFSAIFNDPNATDTTAWYKIQVATSTPLATSSILWDSGRLQMATTTMGSSSPDLSYAGNTLTASTTYYWRIKFWDQTNAQGAWSTATSTFSLANPNSSYTALITDIDYAPTGKPSYIQYGNGVKTTYQYDAGKMYRLINIYTAKY